MARPESIEPLPDSIEPLPPDAGPAAIDMALSALRTNAIYARTSAQEGNATDALAYSKTVKELALALEALQIRIHS